MTRTLLSAWAILWTLSAGCFPAVDQTEAVDSAAADTATAGDTSAPDDTASADTGQSHPCVGGCAPAATPCKVSQCDAATGTCVERDAADGVECSDGLVCTVGDRCVGGRCLSAQDGCDDGVACTADSCSEGLGGCVHDGSACECGPGVSCDDDNPCNGVETCDLATYTCAVGAAPPENVPCDDGLACTEDDRCRSQECKGVALNCADGLPCSVDSCDEAFGGCVSDASACACTGDADCPDTNLCDGKAFCDTGADACAPGTPVTCEAPTNLCKRASCVPATGGCAVFDKDNGTPCDDGSVCTTTDTCQAGVCTGFSPVTCSPSNSCHEVAGCDPTLGCLDSPKPDGTPCQTAANGGDGRCDAGACHPLVCGAVACPPLPNYSAKCNDKDYCEYARKTITAGWQLDDVWIFVPPGSFPMGSPGYGSGDSSEQPQHTVTFAAGYLIAKYEVTVRTYEACLNASACAAVGGNASNDGNARRPKDNLSWQDAGAVCAWLMARRPTEAEWERAAAASPHTEYPWGDSPDPTCANDTAVMWDFSAGGTGCDTGTTADVGSKLAGMSATGALDMAGNIAEWVEDCWRSSYDAAPTDGSATTTMCSSSRVLRGGSFKFGQNEMRSAYRTPVPPADFGSEIGARCARNLPEP
ncbi:MAG: hypothetical protein CVU56_18735 [Deltaproteobacteria bacterium HGW-Deltaproteobacteria-14]|jgi:formylglycine-generating enzyme required for sulfatase activity|nr:MAG: hypothetical protein CVU56_18735 [Deltaproteobacteria bacterium HGW-Deltaproteobacteria-14]